MVELKVGDDVVFNVGMSTGYFTSQVPYIPAGTKGRVLLIDGDVIQIGFRAPRFEGSLPIEDKVIAGRDLFEKGAIEVV